MLSSHARHILVKVLSLMCVGSGRTSSTSGCEVPSPSPDSSLARPTSAEHRDDLSMYDRRSCLIL